MALTFQGMLREAEATAAPFVAKPVSMYFCSVHPRKPLEENWAGLWICPDSSHQPNRGDDDE